MWRFSLCEAGTCAPVARRWWLLYAGGKLGAQVGQRLAVLLERDVQPGQVLHDLADRPLDRGLFRCP